LDDRLLEEKPTFNATAQQGLESCLVSNGLKQGIEMRKHSLGELPESLPDIEKLIKRSSKGFG